MDIPASSPLRPHHHFKRLYIHDHYYNHHNILKPLVAFFVPILALIVIMAFIIRKTLQVSSPAQQLPAAVPAALEPPPVPAEEIVPSEAPSPVSEGETTHSFLPPEIGT